MSEGNSNLLEKHYSLQDTVRRRAQQTPRLTGKDIHFAFVLALMVNSMFVLAIPRSTALSGRLRNVITQSSIVKRTFCRHSSQYASSSKNTDHKESHDQVKLRNSSFDCITGKVTKTCGVASFSSSTDISRGGGDANDSNVLNNGSSYQKAFIAVGSNLGDRYQNIAKALILLTQEGFEDARDSNGADRPLSPEVNVLRTSYLHETPPMYVTDQPAFLNGVVEVETTLSPHALLRRIKSVENKLGRDLECPVRNGPRPIDLDIIFYGVKRDSAKHRGGMNLGGWVVDSPDLTVPHLRMIEREFVLAPMCDMDPDIVHPIKNVTVAELLTNLLNEGDQKDAATEESGSTKSEVNSSEEKTSALAAVRVIPLPRGRMLHFNETIVMGILNVTPDSFSDGGKLKGSVDMATDQALQMVEDGAGIIDVGGESTRPGAKEIAIEEEMQRTIPVINRIRQVSDIPISIDTRHAAVARAAVEAGADIVNDVSGGTFDPDMLRTVADLRVPIVLMHMRGTPETMQSMTHYEDIVSDVGTSLLDRSAEAERSGIPRWLQILDPGIGFAKDLSGNLSLLKHNGKLREMVRDFPILLGPSRKGFIGKITGETIPEERDFGTAAACVFGVVNQRGCTILRVHNVRGIKQAAQVMDAIQRC